jgi:hypothetical protein
MRIGTLWLATVLWLWAGHARAQDAAPADDGTPTTAPSLADELDQAAAAPANTLTNSTAAPTPATSAPSFQSMNPDISVIIDADVGIARAQSYSLSGDDPSLYGGSDERPAGFTVQEVEIGFQSVVDPYFRMDLYLTIPNLSGIEVEEGFVTTTGLPANLQIKAGIFRSALGRQNGQHLHVQDFTRRPLINEAYLGADGLRSPGAQLSWLMPLPFFLQLTAEAFTVAPPEDFEHLASFGGGKRTDLLYTGKLSTFIPATQSLSVYGGLNLATAKSPGAPDPAGGDPLRANARTWLSGADLYVKYKPANVAGGFFNLAWTTEFFLRRISATNIEEDGAYDGGLYTQLVVQVARQWFIGVRQDFLGLPQSELQPRVERTALTTTFNPSEFTRIRLYGEHETAATGDGAFFSGPHNWSAFLQIEMAMGAHGAHPF